MCCIESVCEVLDMKFNPESRLVVAGNHHRCLCIHDCGSCKTTADSLIYELRISSDLLTECESLSYSCDIACYDDLVCKLGDVSSSKGTYICNGTCHCLENREELVEILLLSSYHDGKCSIDCLRLSTGDRSIKHLAAFLCELLTDLLALNRVD